MFVQHLPSRDAMSLSDWIKEIQCVYIGLMWYVHHLERIGTGSMSNYFYSLLTGEINVCLALEGRGTPGTAGALTSLVRCRNLAIDS